MIDGVYIKKIKQIFDSRGFFTEILKDTDPFFHMIRQTSLSETNAGIIKAFHYHKKQMDYFFPLKGDFLVVLYDLRKKSKTYRQVQTIRCGEDNLQLIFIPNNVAHGYKVLGQKAGWMLYHTTKSYNPSDEYRINCNDPDIGFDWEKEK